MSEIGKLKDENKQQEQQQPQLNSLEILPVELIIKIIIYLDIESIEALEKVSEIFQELITTSVQVWKRKILQFTKSHSQYKNVLSYSEYEGIKRDANNLRNFYTRIVAINHNIDNASYKLTSINCLDSELNGRKVVHNPEWSRYHNYSGVYDMILYKGVLCISVYDTIQIMDTRTMSLTHFLTNAIIDQDNSKTTCFTLTQDYLICGCDNGYIKVLDLKTEKILTRARINSNYISEVKVKEGWLVSLDWHGSVNLWQVMDGPELKPVHHEEKYRVPAILNQRNNERQLDFSGQLLVTTFKSHLTCYSNGDFKQSFPVYSNIFCVAMQGNLVAFGCKGERRDDNSNEFEAPAAGIQFLAPVVGITSFQDDRPPWTVYFRTPDNDPVISLHMDKRYLMVGDVNGEIHIIDIENIQFKSHETFVDFACTKAGEVSHGCRLVHTFKNHGYTDFIWALKFDGFRIFSGDETGKILVHDFLHVVVDDENQLKKDADDHGHKKDQPTLKALESEGEKAGIKGDCDTNENLPVNNDNSASSAFNKSANVNVKCCDDNGKPD